MQTFLPYPSFTESARCLDSKRLGKQRVEVLQLLNALSGKSTGWVNHPCTKMWQGKEIALVEYGKCCIEEWENRGYKNNISLSHFTAQYLPYSRGLPRWLGNQEFHDSHKSNLLRKFPEYYSRYGWDVESDLPYVWP